MDGDHFQALLAVLGAKFTNAWKVLQASTAPSAPKLDQDHLASKLLAEYEKENAVNLQLSSRKAPEISEKCPIFVYFV